MVQYWEPGTQYNYNDVVEYQGAQYKIIQPHRSQSDWTPDITPALWGKIPGGQHVNQQPYQQPYQPPPPTQYGSDHKQEYHHEQHHEQQHEEKKTSFLGFEMTEDTKHKLEIGGGLALGAAVLGGGLFAYKKHEEHKAEEHAVDGYNQWLEGAQTRLRQYNQGQVSGAATWVLTRGQSIPRGAIVVGPEHSWTLYICRTSHEGGVQVGKASEAFKKGGVIGYGHEEIHVDTFEVLCGDMRGLIWVRTSGRLNVQSLGHKPVEGGFEANGTKLFIAKAPHGGAVHPGKCGEHLDGASIPYGGKEKSVHEYEVLCYNNHGY